MWLWPWLRLGAALRAEETRGRSLPLLGFCAFLPAFSVSLLVLSSFVSFTLHSWVWFLVVFFLFFLLILFYFYSFTCRLSGRRTSAIATVPAAKRTLPAVFSPCCWGRWSPGTCTRCSCWSGTLLRAVEEGARPLKSAVLSKVALQIDAFQGCYRPFCQEPAGSAFCSRSK